MSSNIISEYGLFLIIFLYYETLPETVNGERSGKQWGDVGLLSVESIIIR